MQLKDKKSVLILIIILMIIVIPSAIWGTVNHFMTSNTSDTNTNKELYYDGKLYFYNGDDLLGTYTCSNSVCDYAYSTIDDSSYSLNYYQTESKQLGIINNKYAFIVDTASSSSATYQDASVILYDITSSRVVGTYKSVKNYNIGLENNEYIIENTSGLWGVIALSDTPNLVIPYSYNYIGLHNIIASNSTNLETDIFAVKDDTGWKLINNKNIDLTKYYSYPIYDYNGKYVIAMNNNSYYLYDYNNSLIISFGYKAMKFIGEYVGVWNTNNQFYLINPTTTADISKRYTITDMSEVTYKITDTGIVLTINGTAVETIN